MRDKGNKNCYSYALGGGGVYQQASSILTKVRQGRLFTVSKCVGSPLRSIVRSWVGLDNAVFILRLDQTGRRYSSNRTERWGMIVHNFSMLLTYFGAIVGHLAMGNDPRRHCFTSVGLLVA